MNILYMENCNAALLAKTNCMRHFGPPCRLVSAEPNFKHSSDIVHQLLSEILIHTKIKPKFPNNASAEAKNILSVSHIQDYGNVLFYFRTCCWFRSERCRAPQSLRRCPTVQAAETSSNPCSHASAQMASNTPTRQPSTPLPPTAVKAPN